VTDEPLNDEEVSPAPEGVVEEEEASDDVGGIKLNSVPDDGIKRRWYALHAHSGQEGNVQAMLIASAEQMGLSDLISNVLVPMEENGEARPNAKSVSSRKSYPGYVLVQLPEHPENYAELWHLIKETPGVTGFIGSRTLPVPLEDSEIEEIVEVSRGEKERPKPKVEFDEGERVKIVDGSFANFIGKIDEINAERGNMKVLVEIFERLTSVEVEFWQVERV
jgi:transcriptional antiterminator NusG